MNRLTRPLPAFRCSASPPSFSSAAQRFLGALLLTSLPACSPDNTPATTAPASTPPPESSTPANTTSDVPSADDDGSSATPTSGTPTSVTPTAPTEPSSAGSSDESTASNPTASDVTSLSAATDSSAPPDSATGNSTSSGPSSTDDPPPAPTWDETSTLAEVSCAIEILSSELATIPTVGVVTFSTDLPGFSAAKIQFAKASGPQLTAPVDLTEPGNRTLLLGMNQSSTYYYRVAVESGTNVCYSETQTITTGALSVNGLESASTGASAAEGFIVTSRGYDVIIFDKQGELVWAYPFEELIFSAHLSWSGKHLFARNLGPFDAGDSGTFYRIAMDGSDLQKLDAPGGDHHDFAAIPAGIAYLAKTEAGGCDKVFTASDDITDGKALFDTWQIFQYFEDAGSQLCHANRIHYLKTADLFTVSDRQKDALAFFKGDGTPVTSVGIRPVGNWTKHILADDDGSEWHFQHGHHYYADDKLLVFSNASSTGAAMLHYTLSGASATLDWKYTGAGESMTQGDVEHLPNGNFLVTASNSGVIHEIGPAQNLIGSYTTIPGGITGAFEGGVGYVSHRPTLYGPPPDR